VAHRAVLPSHRHIVPQIGSVLRKNAPPGVISGAFSPFFCLFLQNEPNSLFFLTYSWRISCEFFKWVRLVKTYFYREYPPANRLETFLQPNILSLSLRNLSS
jgi:hypothetical protein